MRLVDQIAQCRTPYIVQNLSTGALTRLNGAADCAPQIVACPIRFVLSNELTRLCTALAYSKGARRLACADLLHVPAESVWIEWCDTVWLEELKRYGIKVSADDAKGVGHRGALIRATRDGRSGVIRTFWTKGSGEARQEVLASNVEAFFDLDTPENPDRCGVSCNEGSPMATDWADVLKSHFRFRYERSWGEYYRCAKLSPQREAAVAQDALGTIASDVPMLLAFFLLLATRHGLPQRAHSFERLNRSRARSGKVPLLDHIEVLSPVMPAPTYSSDEAAAGGRRAPRLHHVRGHLVRRGSELFWRVPHLRGSARSGVVRSRTVTWTVDRIH